MHQVRFIVVITFIDEVFKIINFKCNSSRASSVKFACGFKHVFHIIKTNSNTLQHLVSKQIDEYHHILLAWFANVL